MIPDYAAYLEYAGRPYVRGRSAFMEQHRNFGRAHPNYTFEVDSALADMNEKNGTAMVWLLLKVTGHPMNVKRESVTIVFWKRIAGKWKAYKQTGIRGAGGSW